jgi:hypothetical protein
VQRSGTRSFHRKEHGFFLSSRKGSAFAFAFVIACHSERSEEPPHFAFAFVVALAFVVAVAAEIDRTHNLSS